MNVYIWTSGVLKNDYIGEVYEYSYDFRNKTLSQVQNDWWTFQEWSGTVAFNSNWVYLRSTSYNLRMRNVKGPWTNANKITMTMTATVWTWSATFKLSTSNNADTNTTSINIDSNRNKQELIIYWNWYSFSWLSSWTYTQKVVLDLVNKTYTLSCTWKSDNTWSITDEQIAWIKANAKTVWVYIWKSSTGTVIRDIKILVE